MTISKTEDRRNIRIRKRMLRRMYAKRYVALYVCLLVPIAVMLVYTYYPMISQFKLAFSNYKIRRGVWGSEFVGFQNFRELFSSASYTHLITNTVRISVISLVAGFFPPIILAIMLFDMTSNRVRRVSQSLLYIPHFFSWVIVYQIVTLFFGSSGYINAIRAVFGNAARDYMMDVNWFLPLVVISQIWKEIGWGTIIYLAALTSIDVELYEVARIDGAGPLKRIWYITLPGIKSVVVFLLTINLGGILNVNTEQILLFYGPHNYSISDVIGTWVYRKGLSDMKYSLGAALSLFNSMIGLVLVLAANKLAIRFSGRGIW